MEDGRWVIFENSHPCACGDLKKRIKFDFENERSVFHSFFNPANRYSPDETCETSKHTINKRQKIVLKSGATAIIRFI